MNVKPVKACLKELKNEKKMKDNEYIKNCTNDDWLKKQIKMIKNPTLKV